MNEQQPAVETQEFVRNPNPEVRIACSVCKKEFVLEQVLHERSMPAPYNNITEGYLKCPHCDDERHCYYMTELLRFKQTELKRAMMEWNDTKASTAWTKYIGLQKKFQEIYDRTQVKCLEVFKKDKPA